jgi:hypothetical protein
VHNYHHYKLLPIVASIIAAGLLVLATTTTTTNVGFANAQQPFAGADSRIFQGNQQSAACKSKFRQVETNIS